MASVTLESLQARIEKAYARPIRLEKTKKKRKEKLRTFLKKFFEEWNNEKNTIYVDNKDVQTDSGRRRSLGDIYMICKYYYPNVTLREVVSELYVGLKNHYKTGFRCSYCNTINKRVWYYDANQPSATYNETVQDEYRKTVSFYVKSLENEPTEGVCGECGEFMSSCTCD